MHVSFNGVEVVDPKKSASYFMQQFIEIDRAKRIILRPLGSLWAKVAPPQLMIADVALVISSAKSLKALGSEGISIFMDKRGVDYTIKFPNMSLAPLIIFNARNMGRVVLPLNSDGDTSKSDT